MAYARFAPLNRAALIDGAVGVLMACGGRLFRALRLSFRGGKISRIEVVSEPAELRKLEVSVLESP